MPSQTQNQIRKTSKDAGKKEVVIEMPYQMQRSESTSESEESSSLTNISSNTEQDYLPPPPPTKIPTEVLEIDSSTPDRWLPRDSRLIRLTGAHPFNVEAPLTDLFNEGFLTSPELFYVRNHGYVPQVMDEDCLDWNVSIEG